MTVLSFGDHVCNETASLLGKAVLLGAKRPDVIVLNRTVIPIFRF